MPTSNEDVVAMPVRITGERWNWKAVIGDDSEQPSNHYAVVWAREEQTLDKAWSAIKTGRFAHPVEDGIPPVDEAMKEGWRAFAELARLMLDGIWEGRNKFPEESLILLDRARHNVKYGPWTEYCRNPIERGSTVADDPVIDWCDTGADDPKIDEDECSEYDVLCSVEVE